jgi:hypothetical protein
MPQLFNAPTTNPPTLIAEGASGASAQSLGTLTAGHKYWVTLQNALSADRGATYPDYQWNLEGWIKTGSSADVTAENGTPVFVNTPVEVVPVTGKLVLSFIRNPNLPAACKVFVVEVGE